MNKPFNIELIKLEKGLNEFLGRDGLAAPKDNLHSKDCQMWHFVRIILKVKKWKAQVKSESDYFSLSNVCVYV